MTKAAKAPPAVLMLLHGLYFGGAEVAVRNLAVGLRDAGARPVVCAWRFAGELKERLAADGIAVVGPVTASGGWARALVPHRLRRIVRQVGADLIHAHMSDSAVWAMLHSWLSGRRFVITHHSTNLIDNAVPNGTVQGWFRYLLLRICARRAAINIAVSQTVRDALVREAGLDPKQVTVIPNGIPLPDAAAVERAMTERRARVAGTCGAERPSDQRGPLVLYLGRLSREKGVDLLLAAVPQIAERFPQCRIVLLGDGPETPALRAQAERLGIAPLVEMPGRVADVSVWLRQADVVVLPSRVEGLPMVILEALSWGVPIVATAIPPSRELLRDGALGRLCEPEQADALAAATIATLANGDAANEDKAERGLALVRQCYGIAAVAESHLDVYRRVMEH